MVKKVCHLSEHRACGINQPHLFKVIYKNSIKFLINVEYSIAAIQPPTWCAMWLMLSAKIFRSTLVTPLLKLSKKNIYKKHFPLCNPPVSKETNFLGQAFLVQPGILCNHWHRITLMRQQLKQKSLVYSMTMHLVYYDLAIPILNLKNHCE